MLWLTDPNYFSDLFLKRPDPQLSIMIIYRFVINLITQTIEYCINERSLHVCGTMQFKPSGYSKHAYAFFGLRINVK